MAPEPWETDQRGRLRATFDEDADAYDRSRPVAPAFVFDEVIRLAKLLPGASVLEIGPGTGQATRPLAERGLQILGLELGASLAERARRNLDGFPNVSFTTDSFERWDPGGATFDAVFACNSFHWLDPEIRFVKAAAVLKQDGHLIVLATPWMTPDGADQFWWDIQDDYAAIGVDRVDPEMKHPDRLVDNGPAVRSSGLFDEPTLLRYPFEVTFTADEFATNLSTQSAVKELATGAQTQLIALVKRRIEARGGTVKAHLLAMLTVAKRAAA